jgi:radical SAM protein with 4Fe4S-binding SPASM domain
MDAKTYLTNKAFCPLPWTGFVYNPDGTVANCTRSNGQLGNIKDLSIEEILANSKNISVKQSMLDSIPNADCSGCYGKEKNKTSFDIISDRVFYLKELRTVPNQTYDSIDNYQLHTVDVRWTNSCNFACVYCGPEFSSQWANELNYDIDIPSDEQRKTLKDFIFKHAGQLKHVYLAGGEPLLMKENYEFLMLLKEVNPDVHLRINTNLSRVNTPNFKLINEFKNVHWIVSIESIQDQFEYIRYGSSWSDFLTNLKTIKELDHKITFNMLHFLLNYQSIFDCLEYLQDLGFHDNSFVISALVGPSWLDIRHLPIDVLDSVGDRLDNLISQKPGFLLEDGLKNMLQYIKTPFEKNIKQSLIELTKLDTRRNLNSRKTFIELYNLIEGNKHGKTI